MDRAHSNLQMTVVGIAFLLVVGGLLWFGSGTSQPSPSGTTPGPSVASEATAAVHVSGAVVNPGLVEVPIGARVADVVAASGGALSSADLSGLNLASTVRDGDHVSVPVVGDSNPGSNSEGIDVNVASAAELESLPGVGPVLAGRIVGFRADHGPFSTVEDLLDVPGIGEAKLDAMRDLISKP